MAGASSLHLWWDVGSRPIVSVAVTLTVLAAPPDDALVFWALQASFTDGSAGRYGGAHVGLQSHPGHPGGRAVNWGGYGADGVELAGSVSALPSATGNPNTRDLAWSVGQPYRLSILRGADGWVGAVDGTAVRTVFAGGSQLAAPVVWTEDFRPCSAAPVGARWSEPEVVLADGTVVDVASMRAGYQADGCRNTTSVVDGTGGVVQATGTARSTRAGAVLQLRLSRGSS